MNKLSCLRIDHIGVSVSDIIITVKHEIENDLPEEILIELSNCIDHELQRRKENELPETRRMNDLLAKASNDGLTEEEKKELSSLISARKL